MALEVEGFSFNAACFWFEEECSWCLEGPFKASWGSFYLLKAAKRLELEHPEWCMGFEFPLLGGIVVLRVDIIVRLGKLLLHFH